MQRRGDKPRPPGNTGSQTDQSQPTAGTAALFVQVLPLSRATAVASIQRCAPDRRSVVYSPPCSRAARLNLTLVEERAASASDAFAVRGARSYCVVRDAPTPKTVRSCHLHHRAQGNVCSPVRGAYTCVL